MSAARKWLLHFDFHKKISIVYICMEYVEEEARRHSWKKCKKIAQTESSRKEIAQAQKQ